MIAGLGNTTNNAILSGASTAASIATPAIASGTGLTAAVGASMAIPIIGAAIAGVTLGIGLFLNRKGPQQKVVSSKIVDQEEVFLKQNLAAWKASDKYYSEQQQCLANFNAIWNETKAKLNDPSLGEPGQRGIKDRDRGGKWDWWGYYFDPIANDPEVKPDPTISSQVSDSVSNVMSNVNEMGNGWGLFLLGGGLLFTGMVAFSD